MIRHANIFVRGLRSFSSFILHPSSFRSTAFCSSCRRCNSLAALRRLATSVSPTTLPSRMTTIRFVYWAMSSSWVTMTMVMPRSLSFWNTPMMSMLVRVSRLPVGSSANNRDGSLDSARAIATRCCWPPESWLGLWSARQLELLVLFVDLLLIDPIARESQHLRPVVLHDQPSLVATLLPPHLAQTSHFCVVHPWPSGWSRVATKLGWFERDAEGVG